jgi:hypothetical protein
MRPINIGIYVGTLILKIESPCIQWLSRQYSILVGAPENCPNFSHTALQPHKAVCAQFFLSANTSWCRSWAQARRFLPWAI